MPRPYITCRQLIEFIADYLRGELDAMARGDFERHLEKCSSCQAYLDSYRKTVDIVVAVFDDAPAADVPEELVQAILARQTSR